MSRWRWHAGVFVISGGVMTLSSARGAERQWLAGDSHVHSHWSAGYDRGQRTPEPIKGRDAIYSTPLNAQKAREYGLSWMVTTDHGGPNHSKYNLTHAYAELTESRRLVPEVLQFYGMELNVPVMDHHTLIVPNADDERSVLFAIENGFDAQEAWPVDPSRNTEESGDRALAFMTRLPRLPLMFANHPSRSATGVGKYGLDEPRELRNHNDLAPNVYRGMEGAPGHQAAALGRNGEVKRDERGAAIGFRGAYRNPGAHTMGGFDQMTAIVGGLWDSLLGEGRRFWIVATSDSHVNYADPIRQGGSDFWPGQYQKTYVHAERTYDGILDGLRSGRVFGVAGDLIRELDLAASSGRDRAEAGGTLRLTRGKDVTVRVRLRDPDTPNARGENPAVARVDLIVGNVNSRNEDRNTDRNVTTKVVSRFTRSHWTRRGDVYTVTTTLPAVSRNIYIRLRGTNTNDEEPAMDVPGEDPWTDLWFYSNPIFIEVD